MAKSLLSLALVATQFLSWSASPLYLCLGRDGSLCIDLGPGACICCEYRPSESGSHHGQWSCAGHGHSAPHEGLWAVPGVLVAEPCSCDHVQISISQPQSGCRSVSSTAAGSERSPACPSTSGDLAAAVRIPPLGESLRLEAATRQPAGHLSLVATTLLRC